MQRLFSGKRGEWASISEHQARGGGKVNSVIVAGKRITISASPVCVCVCADDAETTTLIQEAAGNGGVEMLLGPY